MSQHILSVVTCRSNQKCGRLKQALVLLVSFKSRQIIIIFGNESIVVLDSRIEDNLHLIIHTYFIQLSIILLELRSLGNYVSICQHHKGKNATGKNTTGENCLLYFSLLSCNKILNKLIKYKLIFYIIVGTISKLILIYDRFLYRVCEYSHDNYTAQYVIELSHQILFSSMYRIFVISFSTMIKT